MTPRRRHAHRYSGKYTSPRRSLGRGPENTPKLFEKSNLTEATCCLALAATLGLRLTSLAQTRPKLGLLLPTMFKVSLILANVDKAWPNIGLIWRATRKAYSKHAPVIDVRDKLECSRGVCPETGAGDIFCHVSSWCFVAASP